MPLISLTAAQHSTFLTHTSSPRSVLPCYAFTTHSISETEGKCRDVRSGMQGEDGGEIPICMELIFCFICRFWRLGLSGPRGGGGSVRMCRREVSCRLFYQAAARMHSETLTYMGWEQALCHTLAEKAAEGVVESPVSSVSEVTEPDVVH